MIHCCTSRHIKFKSFISYPMITHFFVSTISRVLERISKHIKSESFISYLIITHFFVSTISRVLRRISNIWCIWRMRFLKWKNKVIIGWEIKDTNLIYVYAYKNVIYIRYVLKNLCSTKTVSYMRLMKSILADSNDVHVLYSCHSNCTVADT
jgi:hypothetical protein